MRTTWKRLTVLPAALSLALILIGGCGTTASEQEKPDAATLELGQMLLIGFEGTSVDAEVQRLLETVRPGGVILFGRNITGPEQLRQLTGDLQAASRRISRRPLFIALDQEGGQVRRVAWLDDAVSQSEITSPDEAYRIGRGRGEGLAELGINLNLAPVLDVTSSGDILSRYGRGFSGTPDEIGNLGAQLVRGQKEGGVLSAMKHFPGYTGIMRDPELEQLASVASAPTYTQFLVAAQAQPEFVMTANVIYDDLDPDMPLSLSGAGIAMLRTLLPHQLVMTDDLATPVLKTRYGLAAGVKAAAGAGVDIILIAGHEAGDVEAAHAALGEALAAGTLRPERAREAIDRIAALKELLPR
ncbi:MAG: glycoside hydrolase family 3 N-terminal domain-containing protein [Candidatus Geothermincolia bacterium]